MPIEVKVPNVPVGYTAHDVREGEEATMILLELVPSTDIERFKRLAIEGIPQHLLAEIPAEQRDQLVPVETMVAILRKDETATLYLNTIPGDLEIISDAVPKKEWKSGELIYQDDIADLKRVEYKGITFPPDAGIIIVFKIGNQRGFFYDTIPLYDPTKPREYEVEKSLAHFFLYIGQQHLFHISNDDWKYMFENQWFPFITLKSETRKKLVEAANAKTPLDDLLSIISEEVKNNCEHLRKRVQNHSVFTDHKDLIEHALDEYLDGDYKSATALIYPRVEGIMRTLRLLANPSESEFKQSQLAEAAIAARNVDQSGILLMPDKFLKFLKKVYFGNFDPSNAQNPVTRHSVGHGLAKQDSFNLKSATLGLLILNQISYFLPDENP